MEKIALVAIAYNRVNSLKRLLNSLQRAYYDEDVNVPLVISIDKSDTEDVLRLANEFHWNHGDKRVLSHAENLGLKAHVLSQGKLLEEFDAIVVLEDDVVVARDFLYYVRQCVRKYQDNDKVAGISLYSFSVEYHNRHPFIPLRDGNDVYFMNCAMSWGQVWMKNAWAKFEKWLSSHQSFCVSSALPQSICSWGDKSWLKFHTRYCIEENKYFVFPYVSYSTNFSDCGVHISSENTIYQVPLLQGRKRQLCLPDSVEDGICYDGFFENKILYDVLKLKPEECCLDLYANNPNQESKRFWLTPRNLPYRVVKSFSMEMRPVEANVLESMVYGNGLFLYDTTVRDSSVKVVGRPVLLAQYFVQNMFLFVREYGYVNVVRDFLKVVKDKFGL